MIELLELSKTFRKSGVRTRVVHRANLTIRSGETVGLLGRNGAGKSTLLRMISGLVQPDSGSINLQGKVSWPVGFQGSFHPDLSGAENVRFVARLYRMNAEWMTQFVREFSELGVHYNLPFRSYSSGMRARLAFALSVAIPFDTYLIDEITSVGDAAFREKCERTLTQRLDESGALIVSHSMEFLRRTCHSGVVMEAGKLLHFARIESAIEHHLSQMHCTSGFETST
jgi:capsular polysaccharide transport system ATP-binding protein